MSEHPTGLLEDALSACGVDPRFVEIEWDDLCQEDVLTFAGDHHPDTTLNRLADLSLTFPSRFVFATDALQDSFERMVMASPVILKLREEFERDQRRVLEAANLSMFAAFDAASESLDAFAARVEAACGFERGELLAVRGDGKISIAPAKPAEVSPADFGKVMALLNQAAPG
ncbi:MAG: hypothetical protein ACRED4_03165, partial [Brevundimonas sp.]